MAWGKKHRKGTHQHVQFSTGTGFWPSQGYLENHYGPYCAACGQIGCKPLKPEEHYNLTCLGRAWCGVSPQQEALWTKQREGE